MIYYHVGGGSTISLDSRNIKYLVSYLYNARKLTKCDFLLFFCLNMKISNCSCVYVCVYIYIYIMTFKFVWPQNLWDKILWGQSKIKYYFFYILWIIIETQGPFGYNLFLLKLKTENTVAKLFLNVWIVPWDPFLIFFNPWTVLNSV